MGSLFFYTLFCATTFCMPFYAQADIGCMDFRKYAYKCNEEGDICCDPVDHKQWHYVYCACPCNEYPLRFKKGKCMNCWHYHEPKEVVVIRATGKKAKP